VTLPIPQFTTARLATHGNKMRKFICGKVTLDRFSVIRNSVLTVTMCKPTVLCFHWYFDAAE